MSYRLKRTVDPTIEPVTLAELKAHLRIDWTDEDAALSLYLQAAREYAETYTARQLCGATYQLTLAAFPSGGEPIRMPRLPLTAISAASYTDGAGATTTMDPDRFEIVSADDAADVYPGSANQNTWPAVPSNGRITITFTAGYTAVPAAARQAILHHAAHLYRNREAVSDMPLREVPLGVCSLLDTIRNYSTAL